MEDSNENAPVFDMNSYSGALEENLPPSTFVTRVSMAFVDVQLVATELG